MINSSLKLAKQLVRLAKSLVAGYSHETEQIGPFDLYVASKRVGSMRYPGDFISVAGPYADMQFVKDKLKALGLRFDPNDKSWYVYWTKGDWNNIKAVLNEYVKSKEAASSEADLQNGDMFDMDMTITNVGGVYQPDYFGSMLTQEQMYAVNHPEQYGKAATVKRKVTFTDNETKNTYFSYISSRQRIKQSDTLCRDRFDDLEQCVGQKIHVVGEVTGVKSYPGKSEITFKMK